MMTCRARICLAAVLSVACGCIPVNRATGRRELILISTAEEVRMGLSFAKQINKEYNFSKDRRLTEKVRNMGRKIAANSWRPGVKYTFRVIQDDKVVNAFALPGGPVYITTGLIGKLRNDNEIAAVLAHEVAHIEARHSMKHIQMAMLAQGITAAVFHEDDQKTERTVAGLLSGLLALRFSRHHEIEADSIGIEYANRVGFSPWGMVGVMEVLAEQEKKTGSIPVFLRTHPLSKERMKEARRNARKLSPGEE